MITLDTSGLVALLIRGDKDHARVREALSRERRPFLLPVSILSEVTYMIERVRAWEALQGLLADLEVGFFTPDCGEGDLPRIRALIARYADLPLGFADAAVIACAERHGGRALTLDRRHFGVVAREGGIGVVPA